MEFHFIEQIDNCDTLSKRIFFYFYTIWNLEWESGNPVQIPVLTLDKLINTIIPYQLINK